MQRQLAPAVDLDDRDVVDLAHTGDGERGAADALAEVVGHGRLDVDDDVAAGQRAVHGSSTRSASAWPWPIAASASMPTTASTKCRPAAWRTRIRRSSMLGSASRIAPQRGLRRGRRARSMRTLTFWRMRRTAAVTTSAATTSAATASASW